MNVDSVLLLLLGGGGAGAVGALYRLVLAARRGKLEDEETLLQRLNRTAKEQTDRADVAERDSDKMRRQRDRAIDLAARFRSQLIGVGVDPASLQSTESLYDGGAYEAP